MRQGFGFSPDPDQISQLRILDLFLTGSSCRIKSDDMPDIGSRPIFHLFTIILKRHFHFLAVVIVFEKTTFRVLCEYFFCPGPGSESERSVAHHQRHAPLCLFHLFAKAHSLSSTFSFFSKYQLFAD